MLITLVLITHCIVFWSIAHLSEADPVGLAAEVLTLGKVEALNVAENPRVILETIGRGSDIRMLLGANCQWHLASTL